jgi:hypothetical protein
MINGLKELSFYIQQLAAQAISQNRIAVCKIFPDFIEGDFTFITPTILPETLKKIFMKRIVVFLTLISVFLFAQSQTPEDSVKAVVNNLFTAMKNADTVLLKSTFADGARDKEGKTIIRTDAVQGFVSLVGQQKKDHLDERISFGSVKIDGDLASVWTPYNFYAGGNFSHCGANSFQVVRLNGQWKIQYLIDTRRRQGCNQ